MSSQNEERVQGYEKLLLPLGHKSDVNDLTLLASVLVNKNCGIVEFMHIIKEGSYSRVPGEWRKGSKRVTESHHKMMEMGIKSQRKIVTASSIVGGITREAQEIEADGLILGWGPKPKSSISSLVSRILEKAPCDVMVYKTRGVPQDIESILYPVAKIPDQSRLHLISQIMESTGAGLTLTHVVKDEKQEDKGRKRLQESRQRAEDFGLNPETKLLQGSSITAELAEVSSEFDLMVIGPSRGWWLQETLFGRVTDKIAARVECSVLLHKAGDE